MWGSKHSISNKIHKTTSTYMGKSASSGLDKVSRFVFGHSVPLLKSVGLCLVKSGMSSFLISGQVLINQYGVTFANLSSDNNASNSIIVRNWIGWPGRIFVLAGYKTSGRKFVRACLQSLWQKQSLLYLQMRIAYPGRFCFRAMKSTRAELNRIELV